MCKKHEEFISNVAHKLGNELTTIHCRIELLQMRIESGKAGAGEVFKAVQTLHGLTQKMSQTLREMKLPN